MEKQGMTGNHGHIADLIIIVRATTVKTWMRISHFFQTLILKIPGIQQVTQKMIRKVVIVNLEMELPFKKLQNLYQQKNKDQSLSQAHQNLKVLTNLKNQVMPINTALPNYKK